MRSERKRRACKNRRPVSDRCKRKVPDIKPISPQPLRTIEARGEFQRHASAAVVDSEALIEADRCYFCYDAPCTTGLPDRHRHTRLHPENSQRQPVGLSANDPRAKTSWAACARGFARPRFCARRSACATRMKTSRSTSACCNATRPIRFWTKQHATVSNARRPAASASPWLAAVPAGLSCAHRLADARSHVVILNNRDSQARRPERVRHCRLQDRR